MDQQAAELQWRVAVHARVAGAGAPFYGLINPHAGDRVRRQRRLSDSSQPSDRWPNEAQCARPRAGGPPGPIPGGIAQVKQANARVAGSDGRRLGRGTSRGTGGSEIPVQSTLSVPSGMVFMQVMPSAQETGPLVSGRSAARIRSQAPVQRGLSLRLHLDRGTPPCCDVRLSVHFVTMTLMSELPAGDTHDVIRRSGQVVAVVVPIEEYQQLRQAMQEQQVNQEFDAARARYLVRLEAGAIRYVSHEEAGRRLGPVFAHGVRCGFVGGDGLVAGSFAALSALCGICCLVAG